MMRLLALFALCRAAKKPEPASKRLVIISGPRTGSSLLIQMLRAHDQVLMHGEPFHEFDVRGSKKDGFDGGIKIEDSVYEERHSDPQKLLEAITATATKELVGFKLFRKHVPSHKLGEVLQWATHVIWLTREDRLAQYVSICLALKSGSWVQFEDAKDTAKELRVRGAALRHARKIGSVVLSDEYFRLWQGAQAEFAAYADGITTLLAVWKSTSVSGAHFSAMTRPSLLGRAVRNRHRHAIAQASRRWRRTRRKILISTQVVGSGEQGPPNSTTVLRS
jgi:LPS sulfotransferase NodH